MDRISASIIDTDRPTSLSARARRKRWEKFALSFPDIKEMCVLDLGGTPNFWSNAPDVPAHVTAVNIAPLDGSERIDAVQGDACNPPASVINAAYDLVVSNSLIEHVGGHAQRARLAEVIHEAADRHWVQTPYRYFPIEPHWLAPGIQFLPFEAKVRATMMWRFGNRFTTDRKIAISSVNEIELIGLTQMREYYPNSTIWCERMAGLIKSMVAIRT
jgi:hypothetical protein